MDATDKELLGIRYYGCSIDDLYNGERSHQSLANKTPDAVYRSATGGGAMIVDKFGGAVEGTPVPLRSTGDSSTAEATATTRSKAKPGQRRSAASEVKCAA
jgi:putative transposase